MVLLAEKWGMGENDDYSDEDWGNSDYQGVVRKSR